MAERTVGIEIDELLLPKNYLENLDATRPADESEDGHEMGAELAKEKIREPAKPISGPHNNTENGLGPSGRVLHKLVGFPTLVLTIWLTISQIEEANVMIAELLNAQTNLLWEWRTRLIELLTRSIGSGSGEDADGKEYTRSLETQREAETFLDAYSVLLNDRREGLFAEKSLLAAHEARGKFRRATVAAMKALGQEVEEEEEDDAEAMNDLHEAWPEDEVLQYTLMERRLILLGPFQGRALKSIMVDLTNFASTTHYKRFKSVATDAASSLRDLIFSQSKSSLFV
jgi:hypothetical protein